MPTDAGRPTLLIIDEFVLRRRGLASVTESWARTENLEIHAIAPNALDDSTPEQRDVKLIILGVGGTSLSEPAVRDCVAKVAELFPGKPCSVMSDRTEAEEAVLAAELYLQAFLSTNMDAGVTTRALTFVLCGGTYFPRQALLESAAIGQRANRSAQTQRGDQGGLTPRQTEVLEKLGLGRSNKLIARDLRMQESTVKVHVRQIMRKLGAANRTQAALLAGTVTIMRGRNRLDEVSAG